MEMEFIDSFQKLYKLDPRPGDFFVLVLGNKRKMFSPFSKEEIEEAVFNLGEILLIFNK